MLLVHFLAQDNPHAQHSAKRFEGAENKKVSEFLSEFFFLLQAIIYSFKCSLQLLHFRGIRGFLYCDIGLDKRSLLPAPKLSNGWLNQHANNLQFHAELFQLRYYATRAHEYEYLFAFFFIVFAFAFFMAIYQNHMWRNTIKSTLTVWDVLHRSMALKNSKSRPYRPLPNSKNSSPFQNEADCRAFLSKMSFICVHLKKFLYQQFHTQPRFETEAWATRKFPITKEPWGLVARARRGRRRRRRRRGRGKKEKEKEEEGEGERRRRRRKRGRGGGGGGRGGVQERGLIPEQRLLIKSTLKSYTVQLTAVSFCSSTWISTNISGSSAFKIAK